MANDCAGILTITGKRADLKRFAAAAVGCWPWGSPYTDPDDNASVLEVCNFVVPSAAARQDYQKGGYPWCSQTLGSKWGAYHQERRWCDGKLQYTFDTAWGPLDEGVIQAMSSHYPKLEFNYEWDEPGCEFDGMIEVKDGEIVAADESCGNTYGGRICGPPCKDEDEEKV